MFSRYPIGIYGSKEDAINMALYPAYKDYMLLTHETEFLTKEEFLIQINIRHKLQKLYKDKGSVVGPEMTILRQDVPESVEDTVYEKFDTIIEIDMNSKGALSKFAEAVICGAEIQGVLSANEISFPGNGSNDSELIYAFLSAVNNVCDYGTTLIITTEDTIDKYVCCLHTNGYDEV